MITREALRNAPMFIVFDGNAEEVEEPRISHEWDLFGIDGGTMANDEVLAEARKRGICIALNEDGLYMEPEIDSEYQGRLERLKATDEDACLAYLRQGGMLAKLPDTMDSQYCRYLVIYRHRQVDKPPQQIADEFLMEHGETGDKEVHVSVNIAALTRVSWDADVLVPVEVAKNKNLLSEMAYHFYDEIDGSDYVDDIDYWEKGHCYCDVLEVGVKDDSAG